MKLLKIEVAGLPLFKEKTDICFFAQQRISEEQRDYLYPLFSTVFLNTTNVFAGINASGKTTSLKVILLALQLLLNRLQIIIFRDQFFFFRQISFLL
jgi:hypothetical protein